MAPSHLSQNSKQLSGRYLSFAEREEIAILYAQERGACEIARQLGIEQRTVKSYIARLMRKTGADNRVKLSISPLSRSLLDEARERGRSLFPSNHVITN